MYLKKHISTAAFLIKQYPYPLPFAVHLKQYFTLNKKHGSKDRKYITQACYSYWRLGKNVIEDEVEESIVLGIFLSAKAAEWQDIFPENWQSIVNEPTTQKISFIQSIYSHFKPSNLFFWVDELSPSINKELFCLSHVSPNKTFLRLRPKHADKVQVVLQQSQIIYQKINNQYLAFSEPIDFQKHIQSNRQAVVQDFSSGQVLNYFIENNIKFENPLHIWDCCAASGGKSILAVDVLPIKHITVSDVRQSILQNLNQRFKEAGISHFASKLFNAAKEKISHDTFDIVLADCPCTGSGTWGRNPENLNLFKPETIAEFANTQKSIVENISKALKQNGYLVYITCSVFRQENEEVVEHILANTNLHLLHQQSILGYEMGADTMFVALFKNT